MQADETYLDLTSQSEEYESFTGTSLREANSLVQDLLYETYKQRYSELQEWKVTLRYIPSSLEEKVEYSYAPLVEEFIYHDHILPSIDSLDVLLYKSIGDTRGRMKSKKIHMYGVLKRTDEEFVSVLVHEFAHYFDIYSLSKSAFGDVSQRFYDISWQSVTTLSSGQDVGDFVSGYAMTNQYEDFAETYLYYMLHNKDFLQKAKRSEILAKKYVFMKEYVFRTDIFIDADFSTESIKDYYWDITKIPFDVKKFLQYLWDEI